MNSATANSPTTRTQAPFTSALAATLAGDVLERFLRYVKIDTQSKEGAETYPSTSQQLDLSRLLVEELQALGLDDTRLDAHGYVTATVPATVDRQVTTVGLIAHVDTSPEANGTNVQPRVIHAYNGGDIHFPGDSTQVLRPADSPALRKRIGHDIVTSDGTTLLGADDKAGVAAIMGAVAYLIRHPEAVLLVLWRPTHRLKRLEEVFHLD